MSKAKKFKNILLSIFTAVVFMSVCSLICLYTLYKSNTYFIGQTVNGRDVSLENISTVKKQLLKMPSNITLSNNERTYIIETSDIMSADIEIDKLKQPFSNWLLTKPINIKIDYTVNTPVLIEQIESMYEPYENASISFNAGKWYLNKEIVGFDIDVKEHTLAIVGELMSGNFDIDVSSYCLHPDITKEDLTDAYNKLNWLNDLHVSYTNSAILDSQYLAQYINDDFELVDYDLTEFLSQLDILYSTKHSVVQFRNHAGNVINVKYNTYGASVDKEKEKEFLIDAIKTKTSFENREPEMIGYDNLSGTYVEVSIEEQHLWHYEDYKLCCESDIVTGTLNKHNTPTGVFYISEKIPGKVLRGAGYATYVNRWMRLNNNGIGLHDASWRSQFGDKIYESNGSHGCINLPKTYAYDLYKEVYVGMPVVVY